MFHINVRNKYVSFIILFTWMWWLNANLTCKVAKQWIIGVLMVFNVFFTDRSHVPASSLSARPARPLRLNPATDPLPVFGWAWAALPVVDNRFPVQFGAEAPGLPMNGTMAASSHRIMLGPLVAAIDQGTSSTRFLVRRTPGLLSVLASCDVFNVWLINVLKLEVSLAE